TFSNSNVKATMTSSFTGSATGSAMADFFLGNVATFTLGTDSNFNLKSEYAGLYVGDTWKLNQKLTLNYGLRWEPYFPQVHPDKAISHFDQNAFNQGIRSSQFPTAPAGIFFPGDAGFPGTTGMYKKWSDFSPRLGLAWDPKGDGRTSI